MHIKFREIFYTIFIELAMCKNFKIEDRNAKPVVFVTKLFYGPGNPIDLAFIDIWEFFF